MSEWALPERRLHPRHLAAADATVPTGDGTSVVVLLEDMSSSGARLLAPAPFGERGQAIELVLGLPSGRKVSVQGEIRRCEPCAEGVRIGLRFRAGDSAVRTALDDLVVQVATTGYPVPA